MTVNEHILSTLNDLRSGCKREEGDEWELILGIYCSCRT